MLVTRLFEAKAGDLVLLRAKVLCACAKVPPTQSSLIFPRTLTFLLRIHLRDQSEAEEMVLCPSADGMKREGKRWRK